MANLTISGNTFGAKEEIKALGGRWDGANKLWLIEGVTPEAEAAARALPGVQVTLHLDAAAWLRAGGYRPVALREYQGRTGRGRVYLVATEGSGVYQVASYLGTLVGKPTAWLGRRGATPEAVMGSVEAEMASAGRRWLGEWQAVGE